MCFAMHYLDLLSFIDCSEDNYAKDRSQRDVYF